MVKGDGEGAYVKYANGGTVTVRVRVGVRGRVWMWMEVQG